MPVKQNTLQASFYTIFMIKIQISGCCRGRSLDRPAPQDDLGIIPYRTVLDFYREIV